MLPSVMSSSGAFAMPAVHHVVFNEWSQVIPFLDQVSGWIFRGQCCYPPETCLQTSLERRPDHFQNESERPVGSFSWLRDSA